MQSRGLDSLTGRRALVRLPGGRDDGEFPIMKSGFPSQLCTEWHNRSLSPPASNGRQMMAWERLLPGAAFHPANQVADRARCGSVASMGSEKGEAGLLHPLPPPPQHTPGTFQRQAIMSEPHVCRIRSQFRENTWQEAGGVCHTQHVY